MASSIAKCSFCGKSRQQVQTLIAGPATYICNMCLDIASGIAKQQIAESYKKVEIKLPTPKEIYAHLNKYVVGQSNTKKALSVAVYNHYKRIMYSSMQKVTDPFETDSELKDVEIVKSNVLLIGPTGCGKTYIAQILAKFLNVPFTIVDATALTEAGYVGEDVENCLTRLVSAANDNIQEAERGIIYIDEVDKIARKSENLSITRDVSGEGVQQSLLKILEGTVANISLVGNRKKPNEKFEQIDTKNILFILSGAFVGLDSIIKKRTNKVSVGFESNIETTPKTTDEILDEIQSEDLISYGIIPELVGRIPIISTVDELNVDDLVKILVEPKNSLIKQYKKILKFDGVNLSFEDDAIKEIAKKAMKAKTGARGLRTILEEVLEPFMFELPSKIENDKKDYDLVITKEIVQKAFSFDKGTDDKNTDDKNTDDSKKAV